MTVTPSKPKDEITAAADRLSRSAPKTWSEFLVAMKQYSGELDLACVQSSPDKVFQAQGRALLMRELLSLLTSIPKQQ